MLASEAHTFGPFESAYFAIAVWTLCLASLALPSPYQLLGTFSKTSRRARMGLSLMPHRLNVRRAEHFRQRVYRSFNPPRTRREQTSRASCVQAVRAPGNDEQKRFRRCR